MQGVKIIFYRRESAEATEKKGQQGGNDHPKCIYTHSRFEFLDRLVVVVELLFLRLQVDIFFQQ